MDLFKETAEHCKFTEEIDALNAAIKLLKSEHYSLGLITKSKLYIEAFAEKRQKLQYEYMKKQIKSYSDYATSNPSEARNILLELLKEAVKSCESGGYRISLGDYVKSKKKQEKLMAEITDILWPELGLFMLDYDTYWEDNNYILDCTFGGNYLPLWDEYTADLWR